MSVRRRWARAGDNFLISEPLISAVMDPVMILIDLVILMVSGVVEVVRTDTATLTMLRNVLE